jgi:hypothetical protein
MPDVGLFTASEPLPDTAKVVVKFSVEANGLPIYTETYDSAKIEEELKTDESKAAELWTRRMRCVVSCRRRSGFSACLTRCLTDGRACDCGHADGK